jgi:uncharacterized repeat protein (TIGR03803 family)
MLRTRFFQIVNCLVPLLLFVTPLQTAHAYTFSVLYTFQGTSDGASPSGRLVMDDAGDVFGTIEGIGGDYCGGIFELTPSGAETVLHTFGQDGCGPSSGLAKDNLGNLYGSTIEGGKRGCDNKKRGCGIVYMITPTGTERVLYQFSIHGYFPEGRIIVDKGGNVYGSTSSGGQHRGSCCGIVYKVTPDGTETKLYAFHGRVDGEFPSGGLISDQAGRLFGTTQSDGDNGHGCGTVFEIKTDGHEKTLYAFMCGSDGSDPLASLVLDPAGNLYGTTLLGGQFGLGTVFEVTPAGVETVLHSFAGGSDGANPVTALVRDKSGNLFGTTGEGGGSGCGIGEGCGTIFRLTPDGTETILYTFTGGADGDYPASPLNLDSAGNLFGTAVAGGMAGCDQGAGCGTVFKLTP